MKTHVEFVFRSEHLHHRGMSIRIEAPGFVLPLQELPAGETRVTCQLQLPCAVTICVSGKGTRDTEQDHSGQILRDKHILLKDLLIDRMSVSPYWLPRFVTLSTESGQTVPSNYWGFNGTVQLDLGPTAFQFVAGTYTR
jgi:hypothetical protein